MTNIKTWIKLKKTAPKKKRERGLTKRAILVYHNSTIRGKNNKFLDYILLPYGIYYHQEYNKLKRGSLMRFLDGARVVVVNNIEINTEDGVADILCRMKYNVRLKVFMEKLVANAIFEGEKEGAIDITRLRLVTFKPIKNEM